MPLNGFGAALKALRERRALSGRELSKLADLDHAYEYRLEAGEKSSPSEDALDKLIRALKPSERDARILRWLAEHPDTHPKLVLYVLSDQEITLEVFTTAAGAVHRGTKPDPAKLIERVKKILEEEE